MSNGSHAWGWEALLRWGEGAVAVIATAATGAVAIMFRNYRKHVAMLLSNDKYIRALRKRKVLTRTVENNHALTKLQRQQADTQHLADQLDDQIKAMANVAASLQSTVTNLTALVEIRGKEHHELRELLQPIVNRLSIAETKIEALEKQ